MKIAMIGQRGIPASYGGIDLHVEQLSLRLATRGHKVTVFCRRRHCVSKEEEFMGVKLKYLPVINNRVLETLSHSLACSIYASLKNYDFVHFQGMGSAPFSFLPRLFLKKSIVTIHSLDWQKQKWGWFIKRALKVCEWAALKFPNKTIVVSKTLKQYYKDTYNREVIYIPNGADNYGPGLHSYRLGGKHKHSGGAILPKGLSGFDLRENGYILFLGRLVPEKGCHYLIRAFKQIETDKKLVIVGGSSYTDRYVQSLKEMATGDNRIIFTGPLYGSKKEVLLKCAYIFVLPSEVEGLSISLFEAMSYGRCVLVSDTSENMEAVGNCGFSFKSEDELDLKERLSRLLSNQNLVEETGQRAQYRVREYYDWQTIVDRFEELYSSGVTEAF